MSKFIEITAWMKKKESISPQRFENNDERKKLRAKGKPLLYRRTIPNKCKRNDKIKTSSYYNYQGNNKWQKDDE